MAINPLPIVDYTIDVQTPFQASVEGLKFTAGREALDAARMQRQREEQVLLAAQQQQQKFQSDLNSFFSLPPADRKFDDLSRLMIGANKQQFDALKNIGDTMSTERKESSQRFVAQGLLALEAKPELFQTMVTERISAETDPNQKRALETVQQIAQTDPKRAGILLEELGAATFGKTWYEGITSARNERRTAAKEPATLAELEAKALEAGVKAEFARPTAEAELAKIKAETLAPSVREAIDFKNLSTDDQKTFQNLQILKKPPAAVTNVNIADKTAGAELGKLVPDLYNQMNAAADLTGELARYRTALGAAITGPFADRRLQVAQVANAFGLVGDKGINATRELIQGNAEMALKARSLIAGQGQGPITEGEQALLTRARAGDINFTKGELNTLFNLFDRGAKAQYDQSRKLLESATTQSPTAKLFLDAAKPFGVQTAPPDQPAAPAPAAPVTQPSQTSGMPAGFRVIQRGQ
jgi:hypothetical protein